MTRRFVVRHKSAVTLVCFLSMTSFAFSQQAASDPQPTSSLQPATPIPAAATATAPPTDQSNPATIRNADVIQMAGLGLSDDVIIDKIYATKATGFDTSVPGLTALKAAKVSDAVIRVMINPQPTPNSVDSSGVPVPAAPPPPAPIQPAIAAVAAPPAAVAPQPPPFKSTDGKSRIYITDHPLNEVIAIARGSSGSSTSVVGDDPRTVELQADALKVCPVFVMISNNPDRADYVLIFRRQGGKRSSFFAFGGLSGLAIAAGAKVDGASLFHLNGDMVYATKKNTVEKAVRDVCEHILPPAPITTP
jgi:hypothetical protein